MQAWIAEMSSYLKSLDSKHMVTVGEEGFWGPGAKREHANPGNGWASLTGQNFTANMNLPTIDFAAVHLWPDNWEVGPVGPFSLCHCTFFEQSNSFRTLATFLQLYWAHLGCCSLVNKSSFPRT